MAADFSITGEVKLNSDPAEKATSKWTVAAGQLIADFAKKAASSLKSVVKSGLDYNAQMESYLTNFKVMLGDEQLAAEKLEEIRKIAASTPFSLSDLTEGTQTLLQFGIAADDTTGVLKRLGRYFRWATRTSSRPSCGPMARCPAPRRSRWKTST